MAEIKNSFIRSKMNKDLDERLIPNNEYRDALNVAVSRSEASDVGALESILGNFLRIDSGNINIEIIGVYVDQSRGLAYYFATDHAGTTQASLSANCFIAVYNTASNNSTTLVSGSWLNFSKDFPVYGISLIEDLLFFSDNNNQPRKINITKDFGYYNNEDQISVAKFAPYLAAEFIDLRSNSLLKPSTMSDASDPLQTNIGSITVSAVNLDVSSYRNGDPIPEAQSNQAWTDANTNQQGAWCYYENSLANGSVYGKLYNRYAIEDPRGLAPIGFNVISSSVWSSDIIGSGAERLKSTTSWDANPGTNTTGFNVLAAGHRDAAGAFAGLGTEARFWAREDTTPTPPLSATGDYILMTSADQAATKLSAAPQANNINGYSVRLLKNAGYNGWNGDPDYLRDKFVKFSYRFKFDDNEYSVVAPFSQDVFIPEQEGQFLNDDETKAFVSTVVEFMQNSVNNAILNITLPSLNILTDYKIKGIDILFKQSDTQAYQILESITVDQSFIDNLNNTNIYQYDYQSTLPIKTLPSQEASRVFDKVPVTSLAQETSGNRIMYGNFVQGKSGQKGLDYYIDIAEKDNQIFTEYPQHSLKQNRNYQVGVILADKFGRQTDIILSNYDNLLDSEGNPQPGSNVFSNYNNVSFNGSVPGWQGDTLKINFNSLIPELANANNVSGYPGVYAVGNYYTITTASVSYPIFFRDLSTQSITSTANQTVFVFNGLVYDDAIQANNSYCVYKNIGDGFIKLESSEYSIADDGNDQPQVTLTVGANIGDVIKFELLFTTNNYYKYQTGTTNAAQPLFQNFATTYQNYFAIGKTFAGLFTDYVEIKTVTSVGTPVTSVQVFTNQEVAEKYLFDNTGTGRPEPALTIGDLPRSYATYDINVDGFYSYRIGVKQQQQDYYNVYLPGFVNGYPIDGSTLEQGETAFTTLVSDNINKLPRNLQEVGPLQNQFTSDERVFPRVTNTIQVTSSGVTYRNTQFSPSSSADDIELIGTTKDVFPEITFDTTVTAGTGNPFCIYDFDTNPYISKISTQQAIGVTEVNFTSPSGTYDYPVVMGLAVLETSPFVSQLELFYEATTTGLISDINYGVQNTTGGINGISISANQSFNEDAASGSRVTPDFFPTSGGVINTLYNATLISVFNYSYGTSNLNSTNYGLPNLDQRFSLQPGSVTGSYKIQTEDTFYAGSISEVGADADYNGKYLATVRFTLGSVSVDQTIVMQLVNSNPTIQTVPSPNPTGSINGETIFTVNSSPKGFNGSATNPATTGAPTNANWSIFQPSNGFGWSIQSITTTSPTNVQTQYTTPSSIINVLKITDQQVINGSLRFKLVSSGTNGNQSGYTYLVVMKLTDTRGGTTTTNVSYSVAASTYTSSQVAATYYTSGTGYTTNDTAMTTNTNFSIISGMGLSMPRFIGQIQNWTTQDIWLVAYLEVSNTPPNTYANGFGMRFGEVQNANTSGTSPSGQTIGQRLNGSAGGTGYALESARKVQLSGGPSFQNVWSGSLGKLKAFSANDGSTLGQTLINAGVRPGQVNTAGGNLGNYDFSDCALVNLAFSISGGYPDPNTLLPPNTRVALPPYTVIAKLYWTTQQPQFNVTPYQPTLIQNLIDSPSLPFYPATVGGTNFAVSPTATGTTAATGPAN